MKSIRLLGATLLASTTLLGAGQAFAATTGTQAQPANTQTPIEAELTIPADGGTNPTPPNESPNPGTPDEDNPGNTPNNPAGTFGIAYQPDIFNFGSVELQEQGNQTINATNPTSGYFHVGVKDKTRNTKGWTLQASFNGDLANQPGVSIFLGNGSGDVKVNQSGTLVDAPSGSVSGQGSVEISLNKPATVMEGLIGTVHNDVYDYQLGTVQLNLADAKTVQSGTYSNSTVDWNLSVAP